MKNWKIIAIALFIPVFTLVVGNLKPPQPMASAKSAALEHPQKPVNEKTANIPATPQVAEKSAEVKPEPIALTGCEAVKQAAAKYSDWDINVMTAIAHAESTHTVNGVVVECDVNATGDGGLTYQENGRTYGYSMSVLQVRILPGREGCDVHDLAINIDCAHNVWLHQGYSAWTMYTNGSYQKYL